MCHECIRAFDPDLGVAPLATAYLQHAGIRAQPAQTGDPGVKQGAVSGDDSRRDEDRLVSFTHACWDSEEGAGNLLPQHIAGRFPQNVAPCQPSPAQFTGTRDYQDNTARGTAESVLARVCPGPRAPSTRSPHATPAGPPNTAPGCPRPARGIASPRSR